MPRLSNVLATVQSYYPQVERVVDATSKLAIRVGKADFSSAKRADPNGCALARACQHTTGVDGALITRSVAYIIDDTTAIRYRIRTHDRAKIRMFDKRGDFAPGDYILRAPKGYWEKLGANKGHSWGIPGSGKGKPASGPKPWSQGVRKFKMKTKA
jgi:hypothetical protein